MVALLEHTSPTIWRFHFRLAALYFSHPNDTKIDSGVFAQGSSDISNTVVIPKPLQECEPKTPASTQKGFNINTKMLATTTYTTG